MKRSTRRRQWPRTVLFSLCPECGRHASILIDGEHADEVISIEGAILKLIELLKRRRLSYGQGRDLGPAIAASGLPLTESEAAELVDPLPDGITILVAGLFHQGSSRPVSVASARHHAS